MNRLSQFFLFCLGFHTLGCTTMIGKKSCPSELLNKQGPYKIIGSQVQEFYLALSQIINPNRDVTTKPLIFEKLESLNREMEAWEAEGCQSIRETKFSHIIKLDPTLALKLGLKKTQWENKFVAHVSTADLVKMQAYLNSLRKKP